MTFSNFIKLGTGTGVSCGVITFAFYKGKENPVGKQLNQKEKDNLAIYLAQSVCPTTVPKSTICLLGGPIAGATAGAGAFGIKNFRTVTRPAQAITWLIAATAISAFSAYNIGNRD